MFSHYSSFIPLVLVLFVWGRFVVQSVTVTNILTKISKMAFKKFFFFALACNFFDEMNTNVHESKCFDLIFAKRKMMGSFKIQCNPSLPIYWFPHYYMSDHKYLCSFNIPYISSFFFLCREFQPGGCFVALLSMSYHNRNSYNFVPYY